MSGHKEIDSATGIETTGHVWDGDLRELNKPLPRWWLYTFYACIVWSVGYWAVYPAWPLMNDFTKGAWEWTSRGAVTEEVNAGLAAQQASRDALAKTALADVGKNPELLRFAMASGQASFGTNCSPCHGRGAQGSDGYPNLNDDDWLWGGKAEDIQHTLKVGIRSTHKDTRQSAMPRFGLDQALKPEQISDAAEYVLSLSGQSKDKAAAGRGAPIFAENCAACHGEKGTGNQEMGAPNLTDGIWLFGSDKSDVIETINTGRGGVMPSWEGRLDDVTIKAITLYVQSRSGSK